MSIPFPIDESAPWARGSGWMESRGYSRKEARESVDIAALAPGSLEWEQACAARAADGDEEAFGSLVDFYAPRLFSHLSRMVAQREEAEDLVQEAFIRAYRFIDQYDGARPFRNWLYTIATNTALNAIRAKRRRGWTVTGSADAGVVAELRELTSAPPSGWTEAVRSEQADRLAEAIRKLPPQAAMLIQMHYQEGMTIREAAEIVGLSEGGARVAIHRARKSLRAWLVEEQNDL